PLLALMDCPVDDDAWGVLDPPQRRQRILDAVKRLLLRESQVQPLLLLFEDFHRIDSESPALSAGLLEIPPPPAACSASATVPSTSTPGGARPTTPSSGSIRCRPRAPKSCSPPCWV